MRTQATGISDESWTDVIKRLTQMGASSGNIEKNVDAVKNLAGLMGGDLNEAALAVGKALNGEFIAFSRLGIPIDEHLPQAAKLEVLYRELAQRGGGQLEARAQTLNGQIRLMKENIGDTMEALGGMIARTGAVQYVTYGLSESFRWLAEKMGAPIEKAPGLNNALGGSAEAMQAAGEKAKAYATQLDTIRKNADDAATAIQKTVDAMKAPAGIDQDRESAQAELAKAQIDSQVTAGTKTKSQGALEKAQIDAALAASKETREANLRAAEKKLIDRRMGANLTACERAQSIAAEEEAKVPEAQRLHDQQAAIAAGFDRKIRRQQGIIDEFGPQIGKDPQEWTKAAREEITSLQAERAGALAKFKREHGDIDLDAAKKSAADARKASDEFSRGMLKQNEDLGYRRGQIEMVDRSAPEIFNTRQRTQRLQTFNEQVPLLLEERQQQQRQSAGGAPVASPSDLNAIANPLHEVVGHAAANTGLVREILQLVQRTVQPIQQSRAEQQRMQADVQRLARQLDMVESWARNAPGR